MDAQTQKDFVREIKHRLRVPIAPFNWAFWGYFIGILIGIGGLGIWVSIANTPSDAAYKVAVSISTYFMASLTRSVIDVNLLTDFFNKLSLIIYSFIILALGVLFFILVTNIKSNYAFIPAILGFLLSIFTWYFANSDSDKFNEASYNDKIRKEAKDKHGADWGKQN
jgi:uncharacterized protein YacL